MGTVLDIAVSITDKPFYMMSKAKKCYLQNDRIYDAIINFNWYQLSIKEQKMWMLMMTAAQRPVHLLAGVRLLNLDTFVDVTKENLNIEICI